MLAREKAIESPGGSLYKSPNGIQWTPKNLWTSNRHQKQASEKADQSTFGSVHACLVE